MRGAILKVKVNRLPSNKRKPLPSDEVFYLYETKDKHLLLLRSPLSKADAKTLSKSDLLSLSPQLRACASKRPWDAQMEAQTERLVKEARIRESKRLGGSSK